MTTIMLVQFIIEVISLYDLESEKKRLIVEGFAWFYVILYCTIRTTTTIFNEN